MNQKYQFETKQFAISEEGFHRRRNGFSYEILDFSLFISFKIEKGKLLNNWWIILIIGIFLLSFSFYYTFQLYLLMSSNQFFSIYIEEIVVPLFPFLLGVYCIYSSIQNGQILKLTTQQNKVIRYSLTEIEKQNKLEDLEKLLEKKIDELLSKK